MSIFFGKFLSKIFFLSFAKLQNMSFLSPAYPSLRLKKIGRVFLRPAAHNMLVDKKCQGGIFDESHIDRDSRNRGHVHVYRLLV